MTEINKTWNGCPYAVFNPDCKDEKTLPVIYGFNNGGSAGFMSAEDGTPLGGHCCSGEGFMPSDLGCLEGSRPDRHEGFRAHYPEGYRMEFVGCDCVDGHPGLNKAIDLCNARHADDHRADLGEEGRA